MKIFIKKIRYRFKPASRHKTIIFHKRKSKSFLKIFILIITILTTLSAMMYRNIIPILSDKAIYKLQATITVISNETILEMMNENNTYTNIIITEKNENGEITSVKTDIITANKLKSELILRLQKRISELEIIPVFLPFGSLFGSSLFSAYGFNIPIKVSVINNLSANLVNDFTSSGINQTRHCISLNINVSASIHTIFNKKNIDIITQIPISDTIIVGETPKFYSDKN